MNEATDRQPPDDMEEETDDTQSRARALRAAWISCVREYKEKRTGQRCYYNSKPRWDGGFDSATNRFYKQAVWPRLVADADELGLDPFALVRTLFEGWTGNDAPQPPRILTKENIERLRNRNSSSAADVAGAVNTQTCVFRSAMWVASNSVKDPDPRAPVRFVINDLSIKLSPLYRYCIAVMTEQTDLAARWRAPATAQFKAHEKMYRVYWAHMLPKDLTNPPAKNSSYGAP